MLECYWSEATWCECTGQAFMVPGYWLTQIPDAGVFRTRYVDAGDVQVPARVKLARQFCGWN
eukprot:CAMPEP_0204329744 /NCGR_PEP_ID=MMETSP0469-20131031/14398_1 /ASSEMBLY_ACC=CAM_ASM_000384 /TAXON_ID=2969 /ORGANISM="Oxyrrhis marina" /LENGTH=61 /DNA_ID=CAMNT_0051312405 /DNA_START=30 /DNA_END=215 /DNA_ORIENTATION=-